MTLGIELANADAVRKYIDDVQRKLDELDMLLQSAPPLRFRTLESARFKKN